MNFSNIPTTQLLAILDVTRRLGERHMVKPLMEYVTDTIFEILPAERCLIVLFGNQDGISVAVARERQGRDIDVTEDQLSHSILQRVRMSLTPLYSADALTDGAFAESQSIKALGLRSVLCAPLVSYGEAIGALYVENRSLRNMFREEHLLPLVLFSNQVTVALENAKVYESLEERVKAGMQALAEANARLSAQAVELYEQSVHDALTGLHNRRYVTTILPQTFALAERHGRPLSLACLDIDNFKQINDRLFHAGGDQVLIAIANILISRMRRSDYVARIGGEEFVVVMPETPLPMAQFVAEELRSAIEAYNWETIASGLHVTASIGVATHSGCASDQELLRQADTCLYEAKRRGKNCVVVHE